MRAVSVKLEHFKQATDIQISLPACCAGQEAISQDMDLRAPPNARYVGRGRTKRAWECNHQMTASVARLASTKRD